MKTEAILMSTHNIGSYEEISKIIMTKYAKLSLYYHQKSNMHLISSAVEDMHLKHPIETTQRDDTRVSQK